jgi:hypothetical protein
LTRKIVVAPNHRLRAQIVPAARGSRQPAAPGTVTPHVAMSWAQRLKRVFGIDIETCERCGGALKIIACIEDPSVIEKILAHIGVAGTGQRALPPVRAPPASAGLFE